MNDLKRWMMLCEMELSDTIMERAAERLLDCVDWSSGGGETVMSMLGYDSNDDDYEEPDTNSTEFKAKLLNWAKERVWDSYSDIKDCFEGDIIHVYRVITAPKNWKPDPARHPGNYWSWDKNAADAHWGEFHNGSVKWLLEAEVHSSQINWVQTLAMNGAPDSEDEREINTIEGTPIKLLSYKEVGL